MFRLLPNPIPQDYDLTLNVNLDEGYYDGHEMITLEVKAKINQIVLHSHELTISNIILDNYRYPLSSIKSHQEDMKISFPTPSLKIGQHHLFLDFHGRLGRANGFFLVEEDGNSYAATLFESIYARTAFPCFDEPSFRATFTITLINDRRYIALSNMPIKNIEFAGDKKITHFETTPPLSTYLVSFIIGQFEYRETRTSSNTPIRVYLPSDKIDKADLALEVGRLSVETYEEFLGVKYSLPKMDIVGIPNVKCPACALEAWGNIVFMDKCLIPSTTIQNYIYVVQTIAHEIAHQWFGNLVSIEWWEHLWLKEAFAQYLSYLVIHKLKGFPLTEYFVFDEVFPGIMGKMLSPQSSVVREVDNLYEIEELYDSIVYNFGASIIRMIHYVIGDENFRGLLKNFLTQFSYHSATTNDFLKLLHKINPEASRIMKSWLYGKNLPILQKGPNSRELITPDINDDRDWIIPNINNNSMIIPILVKGRKITTPIDLYELFLITYWGKIPFQAYIRALQSYPETTDYFFYLSTLNIIKKLISIFRQDRGIVSKLRALGEKYMLKIPHLPLQDDLNRKLLEDLSFRQGDFSPSVELIENLDLKTLYCQRDDLRQYISIKGTQENLAQMKEVLLNNPQLNPMKYTIERALEKKNLDLLFAQQNKNELENLFGYEKTYP